MAFDTERCREDLTIKNIFWLRAALRQACDEIDNLRNINENTSDKVQNIPVSK